MTKLLTSYINQRFQWRVYLSLTLYLIFYAIGGLNFENLTFLEGILLIPLSMIFLFLFRIFDDLQNRKEDVIKKDRLYAVPSNVLYFKKVTIASFFILLNVTVLGFSKLLLPMLVVLLFCAALYLFKPLLKRFSFIIPLFKYPLFVFIIEYLIHGEITQNDLLSGLALLFAFIAYELIEDKSLNLGKKALYFAFTLMIILFVVQTDEILNWIIAVGVGVLLFILFNSKRIRYLHFLVLLAALILRIINYGF